MIKSIKLLLNQYIFFLLPNAEDQEEVLEVHLTNDDQLHGGEVLQI